MRVYSVSLTFIAALLVTTTACGSLSSAPGAESIALSRLRVSGASIYLITADLNDPAVMVDIGLPVGGIAHSESFTSFVKRRAPIAAVTGTYFDTRTLIPTGSIVTGGKIVHQNYVGTAVCFAPDNRVRFVDAKVGEVCDLSKAECGLRTGPRLLAGGAYALNPRREGFRHPGLFGARTRIALGVTDRNKLLLACVQTPVTFARLASIMKRIGAEDAVCLDGGTSSAMYYRGRLLQRPGRRLTNVLEVRQRPAQVPAVIAAASAGIASAGYIVQVRTKRPADVFIARPPQDARPESSALTYEQAAVLTQPVKLRLTKGLHALFPVNRA